MSDLIDDVCSECGRHFLKNKHYRGHVCDECRSVEINISRNRNQEDRMARKRYRNEVRQMKKKHDRLYGESIFDEALRRGLDYQSVQIERTLKKVQNEQED